MTGLDPSDLVLVLAVVDEGSLTGAARRLGTSQPALSRSLRALFNAESAPSCSTASRVGDAPHRGRRAARRRNARAVAAATRQADRELDAHLRGAVELHVGLVVELPVVPVARALSELVTGAERSATRSASATGDELVDELRAGELDVLIGSVPDDVHGLAVEPLFEERPVLVAGPGRPVTIAGLADLADRPWIAPRPYVPAWSAVLDAFRGAGLGPAPATGHRDRRRAPHRPAPRRGRLRRRAPVLGGVVRRGPRPARRAGHRPRSAGHRHRPDRHRRSPSPGSAVVALATLLAERLAG